MNTWRLARLFRHHGAGCAPAWDAARAAPCGDAQSGSPLLAAPLLQGGGGEAARPALAAQRRPVRLVALGWALWLLGCGGVAQAGEVSAELRIGVPLWGSAVATLPQGAVAVVLGPHRRYWYHRGVWFRPRGAQFVVVAPPATEPSTPATVASGDAGLQAASAARPEPVFKPGQGQDALQTERDLRDCQRVAVGQQAALADAGVFQQVVQRCMLERGYSVP